MLGLDATAAQTLGSLWGSLRGADVELVLTGVRSASMLRLLRVRRASWVTYAATMLPYG